LGERWPEGPDEGQDLAPDLVDQIRSQILPLTDRQALAAKRRLRGAVSSPPEKGERKKSAALMLAPLRLRGDDDLSGYQTPAPKN